MNASVDPGGLPQRPLARKLVVHPGDRVLLLGAPDEFDIPGLPDGAWIERDGEGPAEVLIAFVRSAAELERRFPDLVARLRAGAGLWIAWPRRAGGHRSDLGDVVVRANAIAAGLVDVKVAALSEDWSGLRLVRRRSAGGASTAG